MRGNENNGDKLYTTHGKKRNQGKPLIINGQKALAYYEKGEVVGYTLLEEINKIFYTKDLESYILDF